jgi:hypothetical protein
MLRPLDVVVALRLSNRSREIWTYPLLARELGMSASVVHGAIRRLQEGRIWLAGDRTIDRARLTRFLVFGLPVVAPAKLGEETRGVVTAWAAEPLAGEFSELGLPPVWPDSQSSVRGRALQPLHHGVIAASNSPVLARELALVDALRLGGGARLERRAAVLLADELGVADAISP